MEGKRDEKRREEERRGEKENDCMLYCDIYIFVYCMLAGSKRGKEIDEIVTWGCVGREDTDQF